MNVDIWLGTSVERICWENGGQPATLADTSFSDAQIGKHDSEQSLSPGLKQEARRVHLEEFAMSVISIPIANSEETVEIACSELPDDANEILDLLKGEIVPLEIWLKIAVRKTSFFAFFD